jgi:hypothetical protein
MNGITTSSTKSRQLCRIMRCSSDKLAIVISWYERFFAM